MGEFDRIFLFMALSNTLIGLNNYEENSKQIDKQKELTKKVDRILEILEEQYGKWKWIWYILLTRYFS